jgi:hypothetical protein
MKAFAWTKAAFVQDADASFSQVFNRKGLWDSFLISVVIIFHSPGKN